MVSSRGKASMSTVYIGHFGGQFGELAVINAKIICEKKLKGRISRCSGRKFIPI
jgi:hypothetical protein